MESSSGGSESSISSTVTSKPPPEGRFQLEIWKHVTVLDKHENNRGGNVRFKCNYCKVDYSGSLSRFKAHLLKVPNNNIRVCYTIKAADKEKVQKKHDEEDAKNAKAKSHSFCGSYF
ncbi:hypothetical protein M5689_000960 [Euphorbia peplus]|nr:hypothetical protein M5689_000960 [Euphorbia peplus]